MPPPGRRRPLACMAAAAIRCGKHRDRRDEAEDVARFPTERSATNGSRRRRIRQPEFGRHQPNSGHSPAFAPRMSR